MTKTFRSMAEFRARFFPNYVEEEEQTERGWTVIIPRPTVKQ